VGLVTNERVEPVLDPGTGSAPPTKIAALRARVAELLRFHPREVSALVVLGLLLLIGAGLAYARARPAAAVAPPSGVSAQSSSAEPSTAATTIVVHVVGAVRHPGVYDFTQGARVVDAVRAAGGFAAGADEQAVNLARALVDGEQIVVLKKGEAPPPAASGGGGATQGATVNINSATEADFENLPGIGPVLAQKIVDYREQHGPFRSVQDLMKVSGIGQKKFESLQAYVTV
jgi:competence protein ComEA